nr:MAG TPA: Photosynthetic reaction centre, H-chain N-terminal region [Caudoviricetes sp.]
MGGVEVFLCTFFSFFFLNARIFLVIALFIYKENKREIWKEF